MDMGTVGWIALGWFTAALVMSVALGGFLRKASKTPDEDSFAVAASNQEVMRYMRSQKSTNARANTVTPRVREMGKRATG